MRWANVNHVILVERVYSYGYEKQNFIYSTNLILLNNNNKKMKKWSEVRYRDRIRKNNEKIHENDHHFLWIVGFPIIYSWIEKYPNM